MPRKKQKKEETPTEGPLADGKGGKVTVERRVPTDTVNRKGDDEPLVGHFAEVFGGEHDRVHGVVASVDTWDDEGEPLTATLRRSDDNTGLPVEWASLRAARPNPNAAH